MKKVAGIVAGALLFGAVAGASMVGVNVAAQKAGITYQTESSTENTAETTQATETAGETQAAAASSTGAQASTMGYGSVSEVAKNAMPSVVAITNMMKYQANGFSLFGNSQNYETEVPASGSGVIVGKNDTELLIVTNNHVVTDSTSLSVTFCDEESVDAEIKGTDASADLAVVAVKLSDIPEKTMDAIKIISIGNSDDLQVGDQVVAIGNALGYG
ncbi:MAG TPA: peptidase S1, partial [Oribacterium sp.]|nr:peptidase S1 [Oribacterium sp.]